MRNLQVVKLRNGAVAAPLAALAACVAGCLDLGPIREGDYRRATLRQIEGAADSEDPRVEEGLRGLLRTRLERPGEIEVDQALAAIASLAAMRSPPAIPLIRSCAREDRSDEVRYVALEALAAVDPAESRGLLSEAAQSDASPLVRARAQELTGGATGSP